MKSIEEMEIVNGRKLIEDDHQLEKIDAGETNGGKAKEANVAATRKE